MMGADEQSGGGDGAFEKKSHNGDGHTAYDIQLF